ncbi:hypothetical protein EYF80_059504 [Liparis tanakae]|uniref:Uncharacterized protein n=1 Tax=Liparis tanakae TaxID=230148 RepID=A0A4Z2EPL9_9TELE|nr:hypothetical protein EYF80_059504 [Liparis tanakae]
MVSLIEKTFPHRGAQRRGNVCRERTALVWAMSRASLWFPLGVVSWFCLYFFVHLIQTARSRDAVLQQSERSSLGLGVGDKRVVVFGSAAR